MKNALRPYRQFCATLRQNALLRHLPRAQNYQYDFSSNDYLGLSQHPALASTSALAIHSMGVGGTSSRLVGNHSQADALEACIAQSKGTASAMI
ncbi:MAG TPA: hypothetical protein PLD88_01350, partial [Candidatus Berkiella sp.]|nr:hypothetical protein [Candidatus Berkiella sp.]